LLQPTTDITIGGASTTTTLQGNTKVTLSATTGTTQVCQNASGYLSTCDASYLAPTATNFIQNQNAAVQTTANFWISGTGRADTSILTPLLDTATAVPLNIGTTNATQINLNQDTHVLGGKSLIVEEGSATAFQVLGGIGTTQVLTVDTTGDGRVTIGSDGGCTLGADQGTLCINETYSRGGVFNKTTIGLTTTTAKSD
jgi:hypothetical protein